AAADAHKMAKGHQEAATAGPKPGERPGVCPRQADGRCEAKPNRLEGMAETGRPRAGHPQEAWHPAAEMTRVGCDDTLKRQHRVEGLAERARIDEFGARHILIGCVVVVSLAYARTHVHS